jgi:hypothetical protein
MQNVHKPGYYSFPNLGYLIEDVPLHILADVKKEIRKIEKNFQEAESASHLLSGNMESEFSLVDCFPTLETYLINLVKSYDEFFHYTHTIDPLDTNLPLKLNNLWVNFQKKTEFNPNHNHSGVMSFVIWVRIPYDLNKEIANSPGRYSNANMASAFQFTYSDVLGNHKTQDLYLDKSAEGKILLFPNKMVHCVYPFYTSDDYRISVSGNISLRAKND